MGKGSGLSDASWGEIAAYIFVSLTILVVIGGVAGLGAWLFTVGSTHAADACEANLAQYATSIGIAYFVIASYLPVAVVALGCLFQGNDTSPRKFFILVCLLVGPLLLMGPTMLGLQIWGSVLAFQDSMWTRVIHPAEGNTSPCDPVLYKSVSYYLIAAWVAPFALSVLCGVCVCCLGSCCFLCVCPTGSSGETEELINGLKIKTPMFSSSYEKGMSSTYLDDSQQKQKPGFFGFWSSTNKTPHESDL
jgi:hypothetical protein